jgi:hypothetical protein
MDMEAVRRQLQDTMVVLDKVEDRTAAGLKEHARWIADAQRRTAEHNRALTKFDVTLKRLDALIRRANHQ